VPAREEEEKEEGESAREVVFGIPEGGSYGQKALHLTRQLQMKVQELQMKAAAAEEDDEGGGGGDGGMSEEGEVPGSGLMLERLLSEVHSCSERIEDSMAAAKRVVALLGGNGDGKSSLVNFYLQATEWSEEDYGRVKDEYEYQAFCESQRSSTVSAKACARGDSDELLREWLFARLDGVKELLRQLKRARASACKTEEQHDSARVKEALCFASAALVRTTPPGAESSSRHYVSEEALGQEQLCVDAIRNAWKVAPPKRLKSGFVIPTCNAGESGNKYPVRVTQSEYYHLLIIYRTEAEIREELAGFDWELLKEDEDEDEEDEDEDEEGGGEQEENKDDPRRNAKLKREMLLRIAGRDPAHVEDDAIKFPSCTSEVEICEEVQAKLDRGFDIITGRGESILDDRMWVREKLQDAATSLVSACIQRDCVVYAPADALQDLDFMDLPGYGVGSPLEEANLRMGARSADGILVVQPRDLKCNKQLNQELEDCKVFERILKESAAECPLFVLTTLDEARSPDDLVGFLDSKEKFFARQKDSIAQNAKTLKEWAKSWLKKTKQKEKAKPEDLASRVRMYSGYPLLWTSLSLSQDEIEDAKGAREGLEAMRGVGELLQALRAWGSAHRRTCERNAVQGMTRALSTLVEPKNGQGSVDSSAMTREMKELARQESIGVCKGRQRQSVEEMVDNMFDKEVYIPWKEHFDRTFVPEIKEKTGQMIHGVNSKGITLELEAKLKGRNNNTWRSLQNTFDTQLQGSYKRVPLFRIFFAKLNPPPLEDLEESVSNLKRELLLRLRNCLESVIKTKLSGNTREALRQLPPGLSRTIEHAVRDTIPDTEAGGELEATQGAKSNTLEEALGLLNRSLSRKRAYGRARVDEACRQSLVEHLLLKTRLKSKQVTKKDRRNKEGRQLCEQYIQAVQESADRVLNEVPKILQTEVQSAVEDTMQDVKSRLLERRGKARRLPTFFKLYRQAFRTILRLSKSTESGEGEEEEEEGMEDAEERERQQQERREVQELVAAFVCSCDALG